MTKPPKAVSEYMAAIGKKGGEASGPTKARDPEHYKRMVEARRKKRTAGNQALVSGISASAPPTPSEST